MCIKKLKDQIEIAKRLTDSIIEAIISLERTEDLASQEDVHRKKRYLAAIRREIQNFIMVTDSELRAVRN
jgi:hypothetical protein